MEVGLRNVPSSKYRISPNIRRDFCQLLLLRKAGLTYFWVLKHKYHEEDNEEF
jgi:hypothetical protein